MGQMFAQETVFDICLRFKCRYPRHELRGYMNLCTPEASENTQQGKLVDHHHPIFPSLSLGRFWRSAGLRGAQRQVVPGWFGQLGNGVCTSKFLRSVHQDHPSAGLDEPNHELRKVHLCPLPIRPTRTTALVPDLARLPHREKSLCVGCCQTQDALLSRVKK